MPMPLWLLVNHRIPLILRVQALAQGELQSRHMSFYPDGPYGQIVSISEAILHTTGRQSYSWRFRKRLSRPLVQFFQEVRQFHGIGVKYEPVPFVVCRWVSVASITMYGLRSLLSLRSIAGLQSFFVILDLNPFVSSLTS